MAFLGQPVPNVQKKERKGQKERKEGQKERKEGNTRPSPKDKDIAKCKRDFRAYVKEAKKKGKTHRDIIREGTKLGYQLHQLNMAFLGQPVPNLGKKERKERRKEGKKERKEGKKERKEGRKERKGKEERKEGKKKGKKGKKKKKWKKKELARRHREEENRRVHNNQLLILPTVVCTACGKKVSLGNAIQCRKSYKPHSYCAECFTGVVKAKLEENKLTAPCSAECPPFNSDDFYKVQDVTLIDLIDRVHHRKIALSLDAKKNNEIVIHCPEERCKNIEILDEKVASQRGYIWNCSECGVHMCIRCKPMVKLGANLEDYLYRMDNEGEHKCEEDKDTIIQDLLIQCELKCSTMDCRSCGRGRNLMKDEACNVVSCPECKQCICYICGMDLGPDKCPAHNSFPHDNDVDGKNGCQLFKTEDEYTYGWRREHARRDFISMIQKKGYDSSQVLLVLRRDRIKNQFNGHQIVYEQLCKHFGSATLNLGVTSPYSLHANRLTLTNRDVKSANTHEVERKLDMRPPTRGGGVHPHAPQTPDQKTPRDRGQPRRRGYIPRQMRVAFQDDAFNSPSRERYGNEALHRDRGPADGVGLGAVKDELEPGQPEVRPAHRVPARALRSDSDAAHQALQQYNTIQYNELQQLQLQQEHTSHRHRSWFLNFFFGRECM